MAEALPLVVLIAGGRVALAAPVPTTDSIARSQANALHQMILLGVQQGISALPPMSGRPLQLGGSAGRINPPSSVWFRSIETVGQHHFGAQLLVSYFELTRSFAPLTYQFDFEEGSQLGPLETRVGLDASASVFVSRIALTAGISDFFDGILTVPIVVTSPKGTEIFTTNEDTSDNFVGSPVGQLDGDLASGQRRFVREPLATLMNEPVGFDTDTSAGLGRITVSGKADVLGALRGFARDTSAFALGGSVDLSFPSPNEAELAGTDSWALAGRLFARQPIGRIVLLNAEAGYEYDFSFGELRRFLWTVGTSLLATPEILVDVGFGGSLYESEIDWTNDSGVAQPSPGTFDYQTRYTTTTDAGIGDNLVDFLLATRLALTEEVQLGLAMSVPVTGDGFRPDIAGSAELEVYF